MTKGDPMTSLTTRRRISITATLLGAAVLLAVLPAIAVTSGFEDVPEDHVFRNDIEWLAATGVTKGCNPPDNTKFCPDKPVTRGQLAAFLHRLSNGVVHAKTASEAAKAELSERAITADSADHASTADSASHAASSDEAAHAVAADSAGYADAAGLATESEHAANASTADEAANADTVDGYHASDLVIAFGFFHSAIDGLVTATPIDETVNVPTDGVLVVNYTVTGQDDCHPGDAATSTLGVVIDVNGFDVGESQAQMSDCASVDEAPYEQSVGVSVAVPVASGAVAITVELSSTEGVVFVDNGSMNVVFTPFGSAALPQGSLADAIDAGQR